MAEAQAVGDEIEARLRQLPVETIPTEVLAATSEWKARAAAVDPAAQEVEARRHAVEAATSALDALQVPRREDVPPGEGDLPEVREARRDVVLSDRLGAYYQSRVELLERCNGARRELLEAIEKASDLQKTLTRQSARLLRTLTFARRLESEGKLTLESPSIQEITELVWDGWRNREVAALDREDLAASTREGLVDDRTLEVERAKLVAEGERARRAKLNLETELAYAASVESMKDRSDEELIALLGPDGEIARQGAAIDQEITRLRAEIAAARSACFGVVDALQNVENPYSRAALTQQAERLPLLRGRVQELTNGAVPPNEIDRLPHLESSPRVEFPEELRTDSQTSVDQLAQRESEHIAREQQFARIFFDYYSHMQSSLDELRSGVKGHEAKSGELETELQERLRLEKQRYAAARQVRRRIQEGRLEAPAAPPGLEECLKRESIAEWTETLRTDRRDHATFSRRAAYEQERLAVIVKGARWSRVRFEAVRARARLVGLPVSRLTLALTPLDRLDDVDRKNLEYAARVLEARESPSFEGFLSRFTSAVERERFEEPLSTYYLELANSRRVIQNLEEAKTAYAEMSEICVREQSDLEPVIGFFREVLDLRRLEYHVARFGAAVASQPDRRARLEEAFRTEYDRDLPYRFETSSNPVESAVSILFGAECRLIAGRALVADSELALSSVGLQEKVGWYQTQIARVDSRLEGQKSLEEDLRRRIGELRRDYGKRLRANALRGFGITLTIPVIAYLVVRLLRRLARRLEDRVVSRRAEDRSDRERRIQTVSNTATAAVSVLVWTLAIVYVFANLGLDVTPIVASASVVGLAVAFGAQALMKDFFYGFFILMENQFTIGDIVKLGSVTGTVERISLRITVLRDLQGVVHYVPNGSIGQVSNKTQGWSRVVMEVSVAYREDPDEISRVLGDTLEEMAADEEWRRDIIERPTVAGVENLTERSVDIRIMIKTKPGQQWAVAREARRRIKKRFDERGIEIPFPHRVVHHVHEGEDSRVTGGPGRGDATGAAEPPPEGSS